MSIQVSPKQQFQEDVELARKFGAMAHSTEMQRAVTIAISEMVVCYNPTTERIEGAKQILAILLNLTEREEPMPRFPQKSLQHIPIEPKGVKK